MEFKQLIISLSSLMSVTGYETRDRERLVELIGDRFDENYADAVGNQVFIKRCGKANAPRILLDAHMDEIGMFVTDILEGGFLRVVNVGGLDTRILQAGKVVIYGKDTTFVGVVASTPPHLQKPGENKKLPEVTDLLIDTGYTKEELEGMIRIGTPVGFEPKYTELLGGNLAGKGFDNKACAACAVEGVFRAESLAGDVYLVLSAHEETDRMGGASAAAYAIDPDYAMVIDVNLGKTPDTAKHETVAMGGGASLTYSAITNKKLTRMTAALADEAQVKYQYSVSPSHTGTNTPNVALALAGIPVVDVGLPLASMHTYNEVIRMDDCESVAEIVKLFVSSDKIAEVFGNGKI